MQKNSFFKNKYILLFKNKISNVYYKDNYSISSNIRKNIGNIKHFPPANKE